MSFRYTYYANGKAAEVLVPIDEWNKIEAEPKKKKTAIKFITSKGKIVEAVEKGMKKVSGIEKGKLRSISLSHANCTL